MYHENRFPLYQTVYVNKKSNNMMRRAADLFILHLDQFFRLYIRSGQWEERDGALHTAVLRQFAGKNKTQLQY